MGVIDLGTLAAHIVVDGEKGIESLQNFGAQAETSGGKAALLAGKLKTLAAGFAIGLAIKVATQGLKACVKITDELNQASNLLQVQTGATDEEMEGLNESLKNIYASNYGESFEDIAEAMAQVKGQTNLAGQELENATINALALRDAFGYDVTESTRAADMLMTQFGMSADEAFNLITQGFQNGLDQNGNMLDVINEYSVHFKQLGFTAEEMFNMVSNGAETGVFDVDKLGDALKEFGIRAKDGSNTTIEAYKSLNLNADELQAKFAAGGDTAKGAFNEVMTALNECDDEVLKNSAGVALFGTMWEDLGSEAVAALADTNGEFDRTADNLDELKRIKYDDLESAFGGIKKQLEIGLMVPIGEKLLPLLNDFTNWINDHMPQIQEVVSVVVTGIGYLIDGLVFAIKWLVEQAQTEGTIFNLIWESIKTYVKMIFDAIVEIFKAFKALFSGDWEGFWEHIKALGKVLWDGIVKIFENFAEIFAKVGSKIFEAFKKAVSEKFEEIKEKVSGFMEEVKGRIVEKIESFKEVGRNIIKGLWAGIEEVKDWLKEKVSVMADWLPNWVKKRLGIASPSKVFAEIGKYTMEGYEQGIEKKKDDVTKTMQKTVTAVINALLKDPKNKANESKIKDLGNNIMDKFAEGIKEGSKEAVEQFKEAVNNIVNEYSSAVQEVEGLQDNMNSKLADYGSLFTTKEDEDGNIQYTINGLQQYINTIDKYADTMEELKQRGLSEGLLSEMSEMNVDDAIGYGEKLLAMDDETFNNYQALWEEKQKKAKEAAEKFYKNQLETLSTEFNQKIGAELSSVKETTFNIGVDSIKEFIKGLEEKEDALYAKAAAIAAEIARMIAEGYEGIGIDYDGSHRTGLREVPYDDYKAVLHKGEMVLTQPEADRYRGGETKTEIPNIVVQPNVSVMFSGAAAVIGRAIKPVIKKEEVRIGSNLIKGEV